MLKIFEQIEKIRSLEDKWYMMKEGTKYKKEDIDWLKEKLLQFENKLDNVLIFPKLNGEVCLETLNNFSLVELNLKTREGIFCDSKNIETRLDFNNKCSWSLVLTDFQQKNE